MLNMTDLFLKAALEHKSNMDEENRIARGETKHWHNSDYQLRIEEVQCLTDLLNQLSRSLNRHFICIPDILVDGFVNIITKAIPDWSSQPKDLSVGVFLVKRLSG